MFAKNPAEKEIHNPLIDLRQVIKSFNTPAGTFTAVDGISLTADKGEFVAIVGRSGSGKSTLLNLIAGIDRPSSGEIYVGGRAVHALNENQISVWRGLNVGVVFQFFQLLPTLTVAENVMLPMDFCNTLPARERKGRAMQLLEQAGVADQAEKLPATLSGGQQQRAAIARALANNPSIIIADEPTGNLDSHTKEQVFKIFLDLAAGGKTILMATHEREIEQMCTRIVELADGAIINGAKEAAYA